MSMIIDMIFRFFSYTKQEKRLREQRGLVPSRPFPTSLRRPLLFRLAGKEGGEKGRWGTVWCVLRVQFREAPVL